MLYYVSIIASPQFSLFSNLKDHVHAYFVGICWIFSLCGVFSSEMVTVVIFTHNPQGGSKDSHFIFQSFNHLHTFW